MESQVDLAGSENVYAGTDQELLTVNTEDMKTKEPETEEDGSDSHFLFTAVYPSV